MLKMKCPRCGRFIVSGLLAEIESVPCEHCGETVPVDNLIISAQGFTIHRDDLIKRFFRYQKLLGEVTKERELMEKTTDISAESRSSVDRFIATLEEMMAGARNHFRITFSPTVPARFSLGNQAQTGEMVNLSMEGARIRIDAPESLPKPKNPISLEFSLKNPKKTFALNGVVAWVRSVASEGPAVHDFGIKFKPLDETAQSNLWQFIAKGAKGTMEEG